MTNTGAKRGGELVTLGTTDVLLVSGCYPREDVERALLRRE